MCENKDKKLNISCFAACFEQKGKHLNLWASAFKPPGKSFYMSASPSGAIGVILQPEKVNK